jgi:enoyl-CoA hydratase
MRVTRVESTVAGGVLRITLSSPDEMNVLSVETRKRILEVLKAHESHDEVRCVLLSSSGKVFSAGADLNHLLTLDRQGARDYSKFVRSFLGYVEGYPKPTIGLVNGLAVGGGLELLMTLDLVLASPEARFGQTELNVGLIPGGGGSQRLPRLIGIRKAKEMIYTGEPLSAKEALDVGLVNKVVEAEMLQAEAARIIEKISSKDQRNLSLVKKALNKGLSTGLQAGLELESELYASILSSQATKSSIRNFLQRRAPASGGGRQSSK